MGDITNEGILFSGELTDADAEISAGPDADRIWKYILTVANKTDNDRVVTLYRRLDATPTDRYILGGITIPARTTWLLGPYTLANGQTFRGQADAAGAVDVSADGYAEATA